MLSSPLSHAANNTFTGNNSNSWNDAANWSNGAVTAGNNLVFTGSTATTGLDNSYILGNSTLANGTLSFDSGATAIAINANTSGTTNRTLTFGNGTTSALGNASTWIDTSATTTGTITLGGTAGLGALTIAMTANTTGAINVASASANFVFGRNSTWSIPNSGTGVTINKTGAGTFTLDGTLVGPGSTAGYTLNVSQGTFTVGSTGVFAGGQNTRIILNAASGTTSYFNLNGTGSHSVGANGANPIDIGTVTGGTGVLSITAGTLMVLGPSSNPGISNVRVGNAGFGVLNMTGGTVIQGGALNVGAGSTGGIMNLSGGNYTFTARGAATSNGTVSIAGSGSSKGVLNISGGTLDINPSSTSYNGSVTNQMFVGQVGTGVLNMSGGIINVGGTAKTGITGVTNNGLYVGGDTGATAAGTGIVNLGTGGTISTSRVLRGGNLTASTGIFNFHGGTLQAGTGIAQTDFFNGLTGAYVYSEGGTIDNNGQSITFGQALLAPTGKGATSISTAGLLTTGYTTAPLVAITGGGGTGMTAKAIIDGSGNLTGFTITNPGTGYTSVPTLALSGGGKSSSNSSLTAVTLGNNTSSGGLTFTGNGTTTLNGANTYGGATNVNAGTLLLMNTSGSATGSGPVTVAAGAAIGGNGTIGGATTIAGIISPGNSGIGTLNITGNVTWQGASSAGSSTDWIFQLGASNTADLLNITGNFIKDDTTYGTNFRFNFGGATNTGTFKLVDWTGTSSFSSSDFSFTNLGGGLSGSFAVNGSELEFTSFSSIPEASTWVAMGALACTAGAMSFHRRRRNFL